jgi:glycosyltransferase involved in cell wall biosynthesis
MLASARDEGLDPFQAAGADAAGAAGLTMLRVPSLPSGARWRRPTIPTGLAALRCRAWAPDVVHSQAPFGAGLEALVAARLAGVPLVSTRREPIEPGRRDGPAPANSPTPASLRYARWYYNQCDLVTSPSEIVVAALRECGVRVPTRVVRDPLALEPWPWPERSLDEKPRRGPGRFTLLHVGPLSAEERVDDVIRAIPSLITRIPAVSLTVAGEGPAEPSLRILADRLQVTSHVRFVGPLTGARLVEAYASSDAFVTMRGSETSRLAAIEAMAAGLPVIVARDRRLADELDASRGILVEPGDITSLVTSILALRRDSARAAALAAAGRAHAARYRPGPIAAEWEEVYGEVLSRSRRRRATPSRALPQPTAPRS